MKWHIKTVDTLLLYYHQYGSAPLQCILLAHDCHLLLLFC